MNRTPLRRHLTVALQSLCALGIVMTAGAPASAEPLACCNTETGQWFEGRMEIGRCYGQPNGYPEGTAGAAACEQQPAPPRTGGETSGVLVNTLVLADRTLQWDVECPTDGGRRVTHLLQLPPEVTTAAFTGKLEALIEQFESAHGLSVAVQPGELPDGTRMDAVRTVSEGPLYGSGKALCELLEPHSQAM